MVNIGDKHSSQLSLLNTKPYFLGTALLIEGNAIKIAKQAVLQDGRCHDGNI